MFHIIWISAQHASVWMHLWWPNPHSVYHGRSKWFGDLSMQGLETRESRWNCSKGKSIGLCSNCPLTFSGYIRYKCEKNANISTNNSESFLHNVLLSTPSISPESSWRKKNLQNTLWVFFGVSIYYIPNHWLFCVGFPAPLTYRITVQGATRLVAKFSTSIKAERICKFSWATKPSEATEIGGWLKRKK